MESSRKLVKSLKDTLLEYVVLNADILFSPLESKASDKDVDVPVFPNYLFEDILEKSKDMCCSIPTDHLLPCYAARDRLKLCETSFFRFVDDFKAEDLELFSDSMCNLKALKMTVRLDEWTDMEKFGKISKAADSLEDLDLTVKMSKKIANDIKEGDHSEEFREQYGERAPMNLKRLRTDRLKFENFPFTFDPDKLTVFEFCHSDMTPLLVKTLVRFKHLVHLSLYSTELVDVLLRNVVDAISTLGKVRALTLLVKEAVDELMLNKMTENMENLEALELYKISISSRNGLVRPRKKLKVLNCWTLRCLEEDDTALIRALLAERLADSVSRFSCASGLMAVISTTPTRDVFFEVVEDLVDYVFYKLVTNGEFLEAERAGNFTYESRWMMNDGSGGGSGSGSNGGGGSSCDVLAKMAFYVMNNSERRTCPRLKRWIRDTVGQDDNNTHLAKKLTRFSSIES